MENKTVILDTSIWVAYIIPNDSTHVKACKIIDSLGDITIVIPHDIFKETITVLKNKTNTDGIESFITTIENNKQIEMIGDGHLFTQTIDLFRNQLDNSLSYIDTLLLVLSKQYDVLTFDKELNRHLP